MKLVANAAMRARAAALAGPTAPPAAPPRPAKAQPKVESPQKSPQTRRPPDTPATDMKGLRSADANSEARAKPARRPASKPPSAAAQAKIAEIAALLAQRFPAVFRQPAVPLVIGAYHRVLAFADDIAPRDLRDFFRWWCTRQGYLDAVAHREPRRNLDGSPAGLPTAEQQRDAALRVYGPRGLARLGLEPAANEGKPEAGDWQPAKSMPPP